VSHNHKQANEAYEEFLRKQSCWDALYAWYWAELECNTEAMRAHGHHDQDVLARYEGYEKRTLALADRLYRLRVLRPAGDSVVVLLSRAA
jgi:hypothetical protein